MKMKQRYFIIEGGNSVGKSTLIASLKEKLENVEVLYSVPSDFEGLRNMTYNKWSDEASLFFYLSANLELISKISSDFVLFDRSFISSFAIYMSRIEKRKWNKVLSLFNTFKSFMPPFNKVYILYANSEVRYQRILMKSGFEKESDLREIEYEQLKDEARLFLLKNSHYKKKYIDTSYLGIEELSNIIYEDIKNEA
jgi:thymidylate kinase